MNETKHQFILNEIGIKQWVLRDLSTDKSDNILDESLPKDKPTPKENISIAERFETLANIIKPSQTSAKNEKLHKLTDSRPTTFAGFGSKSADLFIISEQVNNDGQVFEPMAQQLFNKMMSALRLQDFFVTAFITRPLSNSDNKKQLTDANIYLQQLKTQINEIRPKVILCFGTLVSQTLLEKTATISKLRTYQNSFEDIPVIATFHPEYLLHQPSGKKLVWQDLLRLKPLLQRNPPK